MDAVGLDQFVVVLRILEAINFHRPKNTTILLSASLDKNVLETGGRLPGIASTSFESNLVWETDRRSVKRMKTENLPIKIECYSVDHQSGSAEQPRSLIGHLVLPLRSVPLLSAAKADSVKSRWYRVIGLSTPEWKNQKPEVQLAVFITDKEYLNPHRKKVVDVDTEQETDRSLVIFTNPEPSRLGSGEGLPIQLLEERGLLQVGQHDQECDIFLVKIVLKYAKQLRRLLPEGGNKALPGGFQMRYELLGDTYPCSLERKSNDTFYIQEKIVINYRTSLHSLKKYFQKIFLIRLEVLYDDKVIGRCYFRFGNLIQDESLSEFLTKYRENSSTQDVEKYYPIEEVSVQYDEKRDKDEVSDRSTEALPCIKCKFSLKYLTSDRQIHSDLERKNLESKSDNNSSQANLPLVEIKEATSIPSINFNPVLPIGRPPSAPAEKTDIESILQCEDRDLRDVPRTFSYNLLLQTIKFNHRPPPGLWQISLYHPRADTPLTKTTMELDSIESETLELSNLLLQLFFSSLPDRVLESITAESSKLRLHGPHGLYGFARLDNQSLVIGTKEKQSGVLILENQSGESIGMATVFCFLDEVGINYNSRDPTGGPEIVVGSLNARGQLDDQLSYKMLEEQKHWMMEQRNQFLVELKQKEAAYLAKLANEWKRKQMKDKAELMQRLEHVSVLTATLEETKKSLALQTVQQTEQAKSAEELRTKMELTYQQQLGELRQKTSLLEEDFNHRAKLQSLRCQELEDRNDSLLRDNDQLKRAYEKLETELSESKSKLRSSDGLMRELEKRLQEMEKSKIFYKQQWAKMIREVHRMKLENEEGLGDVLKGKDHRKKSFRWDDDRSEGCCYVPSSAKEEDELEKIDRMLFEERRRQQQHRPCGPSDHCC